MKTKNYSAKEMSDAVLMLKAHFKKCEEREERKAYNAFRKDAKKEIRSMAKEEKEFYNSEYLVAI